MNKINIKILLLALALGIVVSGYCKADDYYGWRSFQNSKFNGEIKSVEVYNGSIIAGGEFTKIGNESIYGIAKYDNNHWESIGGEHNTGINAMIVWNGTLIVAGKFNKLDGINVHNIAKWNGTSWQPLGDGLNNEVYALTIFDGNLIAGGKFNNSGSTQLKHIGKWNGSSWKKLGNGFNDDVNALTVFDGRLTAGGDFYGKVAELYNNDWKISGAGLTDEVNALTVYDGKLVAGGKFLLHIAQLYNDIWLPLGWGVGGDVNTLQTKNNKLVVGGDFIYAGNILNSVYVNRIAYWDGNEWGRYATGMSGSVEAIKNFETSIIAAGDFWSAGGDTAYSIAIWKKVPLRTIQGKVLFADNNEPVPVGKVLAAKLDIYTKEIVYLDSAGVGSISHQSGEYILDRVPEGEGDLLICFPEDEEDNPSGSSEDRIYIPTYYPSSLSWSTATRLPLYQSLTNIDIHVLRTVTGDNPTSSIGAIDGTANLNFTPEGYENTGDFDFKAGTIVYLKRNNDFYSYSVSGEDQKFYFDSIETGQYTLIADRMGYAGFTAQIMVNQNTSVSFTLDTMSVITNTGNITEVPSNYKLYQNYPNPFNPSSTIKFEIPENSNVKLKIYDMLGREVYSIFDGYMTAGSYEAVWNASKFASGIYFYSLEAEGFRETKRMVLVK